MPPVIAGAAAAASVLAGGVPLFGLVSVAWSAVVAGVGSADLTLAGGALKPKPKSPTATVGL